LGLTHLGIQYGGGSNHFSQSYSLLPHSRHHNVVCLWQSAL